MTWISDIMEHPAVVKHGSGTSSEDLASFHEALMSLGQSRITGVGERDYGGAVQKFERIDMTTQLSEFLEEVADAQNYITMATVKLLSHIRGHYLS